MDQFCGLVGSLGPSHVTMFSSRVDSDDTRLAPPSLSSFGGGSWISSPPYRSKCSSPQAAICAIYVCVDWESLSTFVSFSEDSRSVSEVLQELED